MKYTLILLLVFVVCLVSCSRILVVFPTAARSHYILGNSLARILAEAGHDVTMLSPFEETNPPNKGKYRDVQLTGFLEQRDTHPNTKLFITHGGLLSITETVYHGVPVLALPIFGDQKLNAARAQMNGIGITLGFSDITLETFSDALDKLLNGPKYRQNAKRRSKLMHDRRVKPKDIIVFWTEYVIRHKGADHLRVAGLSLAWYQYHLLDIILFLVLVGGSLIVGLYILSRRICCSLNKNKKKLKAN